MQIKKERKQTYRYSYTQLAVIKPAKAPGQDSIGTGGQNSIGANKREPDSERFIRPQSIYGDLIFALHPIHPQMLDSLDGKHPLRLKLVVKTRNGFNELSLNRFLVGVCGLHVDIVVSNNGGEVQMTIEGDTSAADVAMVAELLCPQFLEFLDIPPRWQDGMAGLMQLITLSHISQALTKRFI